MPKRTSKSRPSRRRNGLSLWTVLLLVGLAVTLYFLRDWAPVRELLGLPDPVEAPISVSGGAVQPFFTTAALVYPDRPERRRPPPFELALLADLDGARSTIDLAVFEYNLESIVEALVRAKRRGVTVRLVLDRENLAKPAMAAWAGSAEQARIPVSWEDSDDFMHSKFVIVDDQLVWAGSANLTVNDIYRNNNNMLRITIPAIVANYQREFEQLFDGNFNAGEKDAPPRRRIEADGMVIETYFSPQDKPMARIVELLDGAQRSIDFMAFSFTTNEIANSMLERKRAGITVRGIFEKRNADGSGSEYAKFRRAAAAVLEDGNCYTMHHKVIIIDQRIVITGSYNFTGRAEDVNSETLMVIESPALAALYAEEFARVFGQAEQPTRCGS